MKIIFCGWYYKFSCLKFKFLRPLGQYKNPQGIKTFLLSLHKHILPCQYYATIMTGEKIFLYALDLISKI